MCQGRLPYGEPPLIKPTAKKEEFDKDEKGYPNFTQQQFNIKCECCGAPGRRRAGCSCVGGKSHQCLKTFEVKPDSGPKSTRYAKKEPPTTSPRQQAPRRSASSSSPSPSRTTYHPPRPKVRPTARKTTAPRPTEDPEIIAEEIDLETVMKHNIQFPNWDPAKENLYDHMERMKQESLDTPVEDSWALLEETYSLDNWMKLVTLKLDADDRELQKKTLRAAMRLKRDS